MSSTIRRIHSVVRQIPGTRQIWDTLFLWMNTTRLFLIKRKYKEAYTEHIFTRFYQENTWGDPESRSGTGSNLAQTEALRAGVSNLLRELSVTTVLDIPCGDFNWIKEVILSSELVYVGGDIVDELIRRNKDLYRNSRISFQKLDVLRSALPRADLVVCRDCLPHFSFSDARRAIDNLKLSGSNYILTTHFSGDRRNSDIITGEWRPISLTAPPFNFPAPQRLVNEGCQEQDGQFGDKCLALYRLDDIPSP